MRILRTTIWAAFVGPLVVVCALYWPANLGGHTTYVTTHGTSMLPRFHAGDLAIVQPESPYRVGEIAAYHSATLNNAVVLHRIVAVNAGHFTFKGDNNSFLDPDHPTADRLVGELRVRVPHGGAFRAVLERPYILFPLLALTFGGICWIPASGRSRRRKAAKSMPRAAPAPRPAARLVRLGRVGVATLTAAALATTGAAMIAVTLWRMPRSEAATTHQRYVQTTHVGYSGTAPAGAAYEDGHIRTGDPVFIRMVGAIAIHLDYTFASPGASSSVRGTAQAVARLESVTGWQRTFVLSPLHTFRTTHWRASASLDLRRLRRIQQAFTAETGLSTPAASVRVTWALHVDGHVAGVPVTGDIAPRLDFQLSPVELLPVSSSATPGGNAAGVSVSKGGSVSIASLRARTFTLWRFRVSSEVARLLSLVLAAVILAACAVVLRADRHRTARDEVESIFARYRYLLVRADTIPRAGRRSVVRVDAIRDLVRLAKLHDELIVYAEEPGGERFALFTPAVMYLYEPGTIADEHSAAA